MHVHSLFIMSSNFGRFSNGVQHFARFMELVKIGVSSKLSLFWIRKCVLSYSRYSDVCQIQYFLEKHASAGAFAGVWRCHATVILPPLSLRQCCHCVCTKRRQSRHLLASGECRCHALSCLLTIAHSGMTAVTVWASHTAGKLGARACRRLLQVTSPLSHCQCCQCVNKAQAGQAPARIRSVQTPSPRTRPSRRPGHWPPVSLLMAPTWATQSYTIMITIIMNAGEFGAGACRHHLQGPGPAGGQVTDPLSRC